MVFKCLFRDCEKYLLGKVSTKNIVAEDILNDLYQYLLGKVSTEKEEPCLKSRMYQYLLGKVSTSGILSCQ